MVVYDCRDADNQAGLAWSHALAFALSWIALLSVSGCVTAPVRVPTQTKDDNGEPKKLDFTFLKSGSTTRGEVTKNLAANDTGVNQNDFFWGRWESSTWGYGGFVALPPHSGAGGTRVWGSTVSLSRLIRNVWPRAGRSWMTRSSISRSICSIACHSTSPLQCAPKHMYPLSDTLMTTNRRPRLQISSSRPSPSNAKMRKFRDLTEHLTQNATRRKFHVSMF